MRKAYRKARYLRALARQKKAQKKEEDKMWSQLIRLN